MVSHEAPAALQIFQILRHAQRIGRNHGHAVDDVHGGFGALPTARGLQWFLRWEASKR